VNFLIAFHIGPVQDFIAVARRTQDLWMGSWMLSHLSRTAIQAGLGAGGALVIPMKPLEQGSQGFDAADANTTNHFLLRTDDANARAIAQRMEQAVREKWREIENATKQVFFADVDNDLWPRQVNALLEIFWAIVPDDGAPPSRKHAQDALDARKRLRDFQPVNEPHLKCSLCGLRQELSGLNRVQDARRWWQERVHAHLTRDHLLKLRIKENGNERLCTVCAVKRAAVASEAAIPILLGEDASFPSTSSIAAATFKAHLLRGASVEPELSAYLSTLDSFSIPAKIEADSIPELIDLPCDLSNSLREKLLTYDGDLFYSETLTVKQLRDEFPDAFDRMRTRSEAETAASFGVSADEARHNFAGEFEGMVDDAVGNKIAHARATLSALYRAAGASPSKYYAALAMDGDHMGAFFGSVDESLAERLSAALARFASESAKRVVCEHYGRMVYAGGDDLLALLPLATALPCAVMLQQNFKEAVASAMVGLSLPTGLKVPTPSAGLAIAHHTSPLDLTLQAMRHAESAAKRTYGRDALCVHVLKRSGEDIRIGTRWTDNHRNSGVVEWLEILDYTVVLLRDEVLSMKFANALAAEASALTALSREAQVSELKRLAKRQKGGKFEKDLHQSSLSGLMDQLAAWAETEVGSEGETRPLGLKEVAQWILLARFIAGGGSIDE
jgi:CRISPR-associated protein Cmr2